MNNLTIHNDDTKALEHIRRSIEKQEIIIVAGAGLSIGLSNRKLPSWPDLISSGLNYCEKKGFISSEKNLTWQSHLKSDDIDELLSAAEFMSRKIGSPKSDLYERWLQDTFSAARAENNELANSLRILYQAGVPICTLNYDTLLEEATGAFPINSNDVNLTTAWLRRENQGIVHLHGIWTEAESCILSIRDYQTTINNQTRDLIQRSMGAFKRLLFVGCGSTLADPNFSSLIKWLRENLGAASLQHYALVRSSEIKNYHTDSSWQGFVEPVGFGDNFTDLAPFILNRIANNLLDKKPANKRFEESPDPKVLDAYRSFVVKDCGQMTIEGIKADMDTTKQKFDIERLFVPLEVLPCRPDFDKSDPNRMEKISAWLKENSNPIRFGNILSLHKRIALLALPGGGKTMLLKRLAVAYADPTRREITSDSLPALDLFPVLIRCREWRDYITSPILTLLKNLPDITGYQSLSGFADSLVPLLKTGKVLLLVDGLDEIHSDADRATFVEHLESFLDEYPETKFVVTSREAGFSLVAPCLNRFCQRFQMAPLSAEAISLLCKYWHILMAGDAPETIGEALLLAEHLIETTALKRLAENPLLLTMLLVVKHGAGRLPPDKVSLYDRAVEVLLDTWNIKGHAALNMKEAIPQLACVAFELMKRGKQTATEKELLDLLEDARQKIPQIGRYAKDSPFDFLKRVELRSSLLLEAGHQIERGKTVPFYQFRHLTFQEYLAAVAAADGHYIGYRTKDTVLTPLQDFLLSEEWKEVIPMAAAIAGKQAAPMIDALVEEGKKLEISLGKHRKFPGYEKWQDYPPKLPPAISRLTQCLIEETEVSQEILPEALRLIATFARACRSEDDWKALARGPYGAELVHQAWIGFEAGLVADETWIRNTCANLASLTKGRDYWHTNEGKLELRMRLKNGRTNEEIGVSLLTLVAAGIPIGNHFQLLVPRPMVEAKLFHGAIAVQHAAIWLWALAFLHAKRQWMPDVRILKKFEEIYFSRDIPQSHRIADFAISAIAGLPRNYWQPKLTASQKKKIQKLLNLQATGDLRYEKTAACVLAFHARDIVPDSVLTAAIDASEISHRRNHGIKKMLEQLGPEGALVIKNMER